MADELIFCSRCGAQNGASASFCQRCGAPMSRVGVPANQPAAAASYAAAVPSYSAAYGGFWIRFVGVVIDAMVLSVVLYPVLGVFAHILGVGGFYHRLEYGDMTQLFIILPAIRILVSGASWLYESLMLSSPWQATLGKKALGLKVTDEFGNRISFLRATGRHFAKYISVMTLFIGFIMAGFTDKKRALHDMIAGTLVMKDQRY